MKNTRILCLLGLVLLSVCASGKFVVRDTTCIDRSFQGIKTVKIVQNMLDVDIAGTAGDKTGVKCHFDLLETDRRTDYAIEARAVGSTLEIYERSGSSRWFATPRTKGTITLRVPPGVRVITVSTASGDISVHGCHLDKLSIKSMSGDIRIKSVESELAVLTSVSGDVDIVACKGNKITVESTSGDISSDGGKTGTDFALMSLTSVSGDVSARLGLMVRQTVFKSSSGDIDLCFRGDLMRNSYSLSSLSGDIDIAGRARTGRSLDIKTENPKVEVRAATLSGDITVSRY